MEYRISTLIPSASKQAGKRAIAIGFILAVALGVVIPSYLGLAGSSVQAVLALPVALLLCALFFAEKKAVFFVILIFRSASDIVFESARSSIPGGGPGIGGLVNAAVIALAVFVATSEEIKQRKPLLLAWAWFFCSTCYGLALSPTKGESVRLILAWVSNFAVFYCALHFVASISDFKNALRVIVMSSVIPVAYGLYGIATGSVIGIAGTRVQSTFAHPNIFAFYLALVIGIVFFQIKSPLLAGRLWRRSLLFVWMAVLLIMLLTTQTRSAWLASLLMFLWFGLFFERRYLLYIFALCCLALLIEPIRDRIIDLNAPEVETSQTRLDSFRWRVELWASGLGWMDIKNYLFGYGIGAFSEYAPVFYDKSDGIHWDAHNVYVQWFFDVGLVGLVCYTWIHCRILYLLRRLAKIDQILGFVVPLTVISYLTVSFSDNMMFYLAFNWYYWFFLGAASALLYLAPNAVEHVSATEPLKGEVVVCN
jgi:O-antigen ligase